MAYLCRTPSRRYNYGRCMLQDITLQLSQWLALKGVLHRYFSIACYHDVTFNIDYFIEVLSFRCSFLTSRKFSRCSKLLMFTIETVFLTNIKYVQVFLLWKWSQKRDRNMSRNEFQIFRFYLPLKMLLLVLLFGIVKITFSSCMFALNS